MMKALKAVAFFILSLLLTCCASHSSDISSVSQGSGISEAISEYIYDNTANEEEYMNFYINDALISVNWEDSETTRAIKEECKNNDIVINMSKYGGFEQVGALGKSYPSNDQHITTNTGDIVLYNRSNLVVFYGSNTWSYTKLGKINLPNSNVIDLLSNDDVVITLSIK